jgi:hypothetical protein
VTRWPMFRGRHLLGAALFFVGCIGPLSLMSPGCSSQEEPSPKLVEGWPPAPPLQSQRTVTSHALGDGVAQTARARRSAQLPRNKKKPGCLHLVERACELLGEFSQECTEARSRASRISRRGDHQECVQILSVFEVTHATDTRRNPCRVLARRVCSARGRATRECRDRRDGIKRLMKPTERSACRGDLLLEEARTILGALP